MAQQSRAEFHSSLHRLALSSLFAVLLSSGCFVLLLINTSVSPPPVSLTAAGATYRPLGCACERWYEPAAAAAPGTSSCGDVAERRGTGQRVISYCVYGNVSDVFFDGVAMNAALARRFYPGWTVRVYHDFNMSEPAVQKRICNVTCSYEHVDFCDVRYLPGLGDISDKMGMIWRFMVLADQTVDRFIVRDLDSLLGQRERDAVDDWMASNLTFHAMRDHPQHGAEILGGMWGGWNRYNAIYRPIRQRIISATRSHRKGADQAALRSALWPELWRRRDMLVHDSYMCQRDPLSRPWPTRRQHGQFVGAPLLRQNQTVERQCPRACRPPQHPDWLWC